MPIWRRMKSKIHANNKQIKNPVHNFSLKWDCYKIISNPSNTGRPI